MTLIHALFVDLVNRQDELYVHSGILAVFNINWQITNVLQTLQGLLIFKYLQKEIFMPRAEQPPTICENPNYIPISHDVLHLLACAWIIKIPANSLYFDL